MCYSTCLSKRVCVHLCVYMFVCVCVHVCMYVYVCVWTRACVCVRVRVRVCVCVCVLTHGAVERFLNIGWMSVGWAGGFWCVWTWDVLCSGGWRLTRCWYVYISVSVYSERPALPPPPRLIKYKVYSANTLGLSLVTSLSGASALRRLARLSIAPLLSVWLSGCLAVWLSGWIADQVVLLSAPWAQWSIRAD